MVKLAIGVLAAIGAVVVLAVLFAGASTSTSAGSSASPDRLVVFLHRGLRGLRITNDTDTAWDYCAATITGGYTARLQEHRVQAARDRRTLC